METLKDAVEMLRPLDTSQFGIFEEASEVLAWEETRSVVEKWIEILGTHTMDQLTEEDFVNYQNQIKDQCSVKGKKLFYAYSSRHYW